MTPTTHRLRRSALAAVATVALVAGGAGTASSSAPAASGGPTTDTHQGQVHADRLAGADRYETAAEIARQYPGQTDAVYVATGTNFADALSARDSRTTTQSASSKDQRGADSHDDGCAEADQEPCLSAPILLTRSETLPEATVAALEQLQPRTIRIVGGSAAVSTAVEEQLRSYGNVVRLGGATRYETSAEIAAQFPAGLPVVFVATGEDFPDALAGGAVAGRAHAPVLLTDGEELRPATEQALIDLEPQSVVLLGGSAAVSADVEAAIRQIVPDTIRVSGTDRYDTAALLAAHYEQDLPTAFVATGHDYPDALAGAALAGAHGVPMLLTPPGKLSSATAEALAGLSPQGITILGGEGAVSATVGGAVNAQLPGWVDSIHLQLLSFNDFHGHLEAEEGATLSEEQDPEQHVVGGAEYLSTTLERLRTGAREDQSMTVAAGDLIGGSPFLSGVFHDEPTVESLNLMGLDVSSVGNHEFDEGTEELLRMQEGGCHPEDGCYFPSEPYAGADFSWLAANVVVEETGETLLPATYTRTIGNVEVGFIGMTLEETPSLVSPGGVASVDFLDEVETANAQAAALQERGVEAIVVLLHEGGYQSGTYQGCEGISGPIVDIHDGLDASIDAVVTGHTHQPYICTLADPNGEPRMVTSAAQYGRLVTETDLALSRSSGDVIREQVTSANHLVTRESADPAVTQVIAKWSALADDVRAEVIGEATEAITGDAGGDRGIETPMANLVADSILWGTDGPDEGGAEIAFMNVGGVRASLDEGPITFEEAFAVMPFGNILVSIDLTGAQVKEVLEQQFVPERGRPYLALGVSEGFTYTWDDTQPQGSKVSEMMLNGTPIDLDATYRVSTLNFLQEGGDSFTAFTQGTNPQVGPEDLANIVAFLEAESPVSAPGDRVNGL